VGLIMLGWHFLREDKRLRWGSTEIVKPGKWLRVEGDLLMCEHGLHASKRAIDALEYAPGPIICRVELRGDMIHDTDKSVARERRVVWMADATYTLHEFACRCAEDALARIENPDPRSIAAIAAKRAWLKGDITDHQLDAAGAAAWAAAWGAAGVAARVAAGDAAGGAAWAAACDAAWDAARVAARVAGWDATWVAAGYAAWVAARVAARVAGWDAARGHQNRRLTAMLSRLKP
jgi:hypothetical protein